MTILTTTAYAGSEEAHILTPMSHTATLRILIVDDDDDVCRSYEACFEAAGFAAASATSADAALDRLRREARPDVIVLDYAMPGKTGIDLLNVLRDDPKTRSIPVLMVSGKDRDLQSVHGTPWLRKPVAPEELIAHIRNAAGVT
jgi:two-component system, OmpR family, phosphate regulon response regulator PhoB